MEDKTYTFELPKRKTKKTSKFVTEPYISKNPVLKFLDFFDFGMPYRSRKVFWLVLTAPIIILFSLSALTYVYFLIVPPKGYANPGGWLILLQLYPFYFLYLVILRTRRDCKFYGFLGITWLNIGRVLRYLVISLPLLFAILMFIIEVVEPMIDPTQPSGIGMTILPFAVFLLIIAVVNEENK